MLRVFDNSYRHSSEIASLARDIGKDANENDIDRLLKVDDAADAPVVRLLHSLLEEAVARRASDIHIEPDENVLRIRLRIDGERKSTRLNSSPNSHLLFRLLLVKNTNTKQQPN